MAHAGDLLTLAEHLAAPVPEVPEQAWLRRSISTAYYAVFHLLVQEAAQRWNGTPAARAGVERVFRHDQMKDTCRAVGKGSWKGWSVPPLDVPSVLRGVADSFIRLQEARHQADYDNEKRWTRADVAVLVGAARIAFRMWDEIRGTEVADEFLLSLLIGKKRE